MADVFSKKKRSHVMSLIRSDGNKDTELAVVRLFRAYHISGWRRHWPLKGRPDFVFPALRIVVFVDGCFWHGCAKHSRTPTGNREYWSGKLGRNKARDRAVTRHLRRLGWRVVRLWEHDLGNPKLCLRRVLPS
ncbi:MAG: very short patch repair endonuclease [Planctomycetota bacterium]